jgi:XTP/dITP diphosphohydrolase
VSTAWPLRLVIASHNKGKVAEIEELLAPHGVAVTSAAELGVDEPEETGDSFTANARLRARAAAAASGLPALADDSGLTVPALGGAPGIMSARWAGPKRDFNAAMARLERELAARSDRRAAFVCVLALALPDGEARCFEGRVKGTLTFPPRGARGFGYDPIFIPDGHTETFGEMDPILKNAMSHRAIAFAKLLNAHRA